MEIKSNVNPLQLKHEWQKINDDSLLNDPKKREFFAQLHACVKID